MMLSRHFVKQAGFRVLEGGNRDFPTRAPSKPQSTDLTVRGWGDVGFLVLRVWEGWFRAGCVRV